MNKNMTALISAFARSYHTINSNIKIYDDKYGKDIITEEEYTNISNNMTNGIKFFNPNYKGNNPLEWIVNSYLVPTVIARSAFNERHLLNEIKLSLKQYVVLASGYDTSGYKVNNKVKVFELDTKEMIEDKQKRIESAKIDSSNVYYIKCDFNKPWINNLLKSNFNKNEKTLCSLLGISYYLDKDIFYKTIEDLSNNIQLGSAIIFDYPNNNETEKEIKNKQLAYKANEEMKSTYSYNDIELLADRCNLLIYEHLNSEDIDKDYFYNYNTLNPNNKIIAPKGVSYCLLVKKGW